MIENDKHLQFSYAQLARMYRLCDSIAEEVTGDAETREDEIEGIRSMIRKIESKVAEYLEKHPLEERFAAAGR